ncbi:MAG: hypothetical protein AAB466_11670 [Verrucomicrobiota bacterium]|mgnify:CR=1 FL=1
MVIRLTAKSAVLRRRGTLMTEMVVAMSILVLTIIPLGFSFLREQQLCRAYYFQALAMEIVDGEMEILRAGEWRSFADGSHPYPVRAASVKNLPPGRFVLTRQSDLIRLEWLPEKSHKGGKVLREVRLAGAK